MFCPFLKNERCGSCSCALYLASEDVCLLREALLKYLSDTEKKDKEIEDIKEQCKYAAFGFPVMFNRKDR